ncbi:DUF3068 domain-containing protein [Spirillospora sp. NBC_00431]
MRQPGGLILIGLGAFFLALAPLVRFYVADRAVTAPLNSHEVTRLESENSTYFDESRLKLKTGVTLLAKTTVHAEANGNDIATWDSATHLYEKPAPDKPIQIQSHRVAFDRRTGRLVNCCGVNVDGDRTVRMAGYGPLFPIANVQKRDYPSYDLTTKQQAPMRFDGVEKVRGLTTYRFTQTIPLTRTSAFDVKVPAGLLGLPPNAGDQKVDRYTEASNTVWVDPRTGIPVKHRKNVRGTVRTLDGKASMVITQADLITVGADQRRLIDMADDKALQITVVRTYVPGAALLIALILLSVGTHQTLTRPATTDTRSKQHSEEDMQPLQ